MADDSTLAGKVLAFRRAGAGVDVIAERLDLTAARVIELFEEALAALDPRVPAKLEADRLDRLHLAIWPAAVAGDVNAIDRVLRISERREAVLAAPAANDHALRDAFDASVASSQMTAVDSSLIAFGRTIAERVDEAVATGKGQELTKALYLVPHAVNILREALATPASRNAAGVVVNEFKDGRLAQLRAVQDASKSG